MDALTGNRATAAADFSRARRRAALQQVLSRVTGKSAALFSYEDVRKRLRGQQLSVRELREIPLDAIVGSTGRYREFTKSFLPLGIINRNRWIKVKLAMLGLRGVPPIEVYQIGSAYFVQDGNHRISVARAMGFKHIQAYVTPVKTKVSLSPDTEPDELILKAELTAFLEASQIDVLLPDADLRVTSPGQYRVLQEHIDVHRYFMAEEQQREVPYTHAVRHWHETAYLPIVKLIRERGMLRGFPRRTETDLYLWISAHKAELERQLEWEVSADRAASDLTKRYGVSPRVGRGGAGERLKGTLSRPRPLVASAAEPAERMSSGATDERIAGRVDRVVHDVLVAVDGRQPGWHALEQAIVVARQERARLQGLHVVSTARLRDSDAVRALQAEFVRRCREAMIPGRLAVDVGDYVRQIRSRTRWTDIVIAGIARPASRPASVSEALQDLIDDCPRPVLVVPEEATALDRVLIAFDGSEKSREALLVATYMAGWWNTALVVLTVSESGRGVARIQKSAANYLAARDVSASYLRARGDADDAILQTAADQGCNLVIMGGYGHSMPLKILLGSAVYGVLRRSESPVLICT